jgi:hypothetical protein
MTVEELMVAGSMAELNAISMELLRGTAVALLAGVVVITFGVGLGSLLSFLQPATKKMDNKDTS